jgi:hypothetical protein
VAPLDAGTYSLSMSRQLPRSSADFCWALPGDPCGQVTDDEVSQAFKAASPSASFARRSLSDIAYQARQSGLVLSLRKTAS